MEEETKLETPEEKGGTGKNGKAFMRQAITQAKKAEKLMEVPYRLCDCELRGKR